MMRTAVRHRSARDGRGKCRGSTTGRPYVWAKASAAMGELSVRIALPIDMKNLGRSERAPREGPDTHPNVAAEAQHVLPKRPHQPVGPGAVPHDVDAAEDEADDEADRWQCQPVQSRDPCMAYSRPSWPPS